MACGVPLGPGSPATEVATLISATGLGEGKRSREPKTNEQMQTKRELEVRRRTDRASC